MNEQSLTPSFCSRCGASVQADANFCHTCGARLQKLPDTPSQAAAPEPPPPLPPPSPVPAAAIRSDGFQGIKKFLSAAGTILFGILWLVGIALLFVGGAWVGAYVEPWIAFVAVTLIVIGLPICLLLLIFRQSRGWGGTGIFFLSLPLSLWLWVASLVYAMSVSMVWTVIGVLMGGLGVIPVALIMTLFRRDWPNFGGLAVTGIFVLVLRFFGAWIVDRSEQREFGIGGAKVGPSALLGVLTLILGLLTVFFGFRAVLGEAAPDQDPALFAIGSFTLVAICGVVAAVCGYLTYRCMKAGPRKPSR